MSLDRSRLFGAALIGASLAGCAGVASDEPCDRACLVAMTDSYFNALGARAPGSAAFGSAVRLTENGVAVAPSSSVFASARPMRWHQVFADPVTGQTSSFARYDDDAGPVLYAVRLKIAQRQIVESEAMVNRKGAHPFFAPDALAAPRPTFEAVTPSGRAATAERLRALAELTPTASSNTAASASPSTPSACGSRMAFARPTTPWPICRVAARAACRCSPISRRFVIAAIR